MRVRVERAKCMASGNCVLAAPTVFRQDEDGLVEVLDSAPAAELLGQIEDAVRACPAAVISLAN